MPGGIEQCKRDRHLLNHPIRGRIGGMEYGKQVHTGDRRLEQATMSRCDEIAMSVGSINSGKLISTW